MKSFLLLALTVSFAAAGLPTPEEDLTALKAEYAKREAAAVRPVKDWFADELLKREKALLAAGKTLPAAAVAKERATMLLCSTPWTWEAVGLPPFQIVLNPDGTGVHSAKKDRFAWTLEGNKVTMSLRDGRKSVVEFDLVALKFKGNDFGVADRKVTGVPAKL